MYIFRQRNKFKCSMTDFDKMFKLCSYFYSLFCFLFLLNCNKHTCIPNTFLECPIGYHRNHCSEKCIYPVYGEDCQNICECNKNFCDFAFGCSGHVTIATDYDQLGNRYDSFIFFF